MKRGDLTMKAVDPVPEGKVLLAKGKMSVVLTDEELRWLVLAAGPALLAEHAPLPRAVER